MHLRPGRRLDFLGLRQQRCIHHAHASHAIHQAVVHLEVKRETPVGQAFDEAALPQRSIAVEQGRVQLRHQDQQFADAARTRQGQVPQVVVEIEFLILVPQPATRLVDRAQIERGIGRQVRSPCLIEFLHEVIAGTLGRRVYLQRGDVHRLFPLLDQKKQHVLRIHGLDGFSPGVIRCSRPLGSWKARQTPISGLPGVHRELVQYPFG